MSPVKTMNLNGFTLLEVMIALAILMIGILATAGLQGIVIRNNTTGNIATQAVLLAQSRIDKIKNQTKISSLNNSFDAETDVTPLNGNDEEIEGGAIFTIDYRFCDPMQAILSNSYNNYPSSSCDPSVSSSDFALCGNAQKCSSATSGTCMAAVRVSWERGEKGRAGTGCVIMQTLTQGNGV